MKRILIFLTVALALSSCVSESEHQRIVDEKNALSTENQNLKNELEEIKFGAPNLLSDGKSFIKQKTFHRQGRNSKRFCKSTPTCLNLLKQKIILPILMKKNFGKKPSLQKKLVILKIT